MATAATFLSIFVCISLAFHSRNSRAFSRDERRDRKHKIFAKRSGERRWRAAAAVVRGEREIFDGD